MDPERGENERRLRVDSRASETRACVKITPREKRRHAAGREKNERVAFLALSFILLSSICRR